ncbi:hypothetical protein ACLHZ0_21115 [Aeromonas salmonicida]|uniref:hypothetical protein n=1 Tax=Aeromonas salmonicida TaxID=645 RepID=UPI003CFF32C1
MKINTRFMLKAVGVSVGVFVAVVAVQTYQLLKVCDERRSAAIQAWVKNNEGGELILSAYRKCVRGPVDPTDKIVPLLSFSDCAVWAGSQSLADEIEQSSRDVIAPIPLRWL